MRGLEGRCLEESISRSESSSNASPRSKDSSEGLSMERREREMEAKVMGDTGRCRGGKEK